MGQVWCFTPLIPDRKVGLGYTACSRPSWVSGVGGETLYKAADHCCVEEELPGMHKAMGSTTNTTKQKPLDHKV